MLPIYITRDLNLYKPRACDFTVRIFIGETSKIENTWLSIL